jgi:hypothetical protein
MVRVLSAFILGLLSVSAALAAAAGGGDPTWKVSELWKPGNKHFTDKGTRIFESDGSMLRSLRVSRQALRTGESCETALARLKARSIGEPFEFGKESRWNGWGSWDDDRDAVDGCDEFPCKIKFDEPETKAIAAKPEAGRLAEVLAQIDRRVAEYEKTFRRRGYDLPEDAVDPWKVFATKGHALPATFAKSKPKFVARKQMFGDGNYRPIRQIFDERLFEEKNRLVRMARDVYTAHYFDGWGEWLEFRCIPERREILFLQDLLMEFDLLKNTDFFSVIARPKMRQGVDHESLKYQKTQAEKLLAP